MFVDESISFAYGENDTNDSVLLEAMFCDKQLQRMSILSPNRNLDDSFVIESKRLCATNSSLKWNCCLVEVLELRNMLSISLQTAASALHRKESRGSHYRQDFPGEIFGFHSVVSWLIINLVVL